MRTRQAGMVVAYGGGRGGARVVDLTRCIAGMCGRRVGGCAHESGLWWQTRSRSTCS